MAWYTLTQCMHLLGINNHRLKKLLEVSSIVLEVSSTDRRERLLSEDQFRQLSEANSAYPRAKTSTHPGTATIQALQAENQELRRRIEHIEHILSIRNKQAYITQSPQRKQPSQQPRPQPPATPTESLPPNHIGWREWARLHNIPETTGQKARKAGRLKTIEGPWKRNNVWVKEALDTDGQRTAYSLWSNSPRFRACEHCPDKHSS